jgi:hypothetical protein
VLAVLMAGMLGLGEMMLCLCLTDSVTADQFDFVRRLTINFDGLGSD